MITIKNRFSTNKQNNNNVENASSNSDSQINEESSNDQQSFESLNSIFNLNSNDLDSHVLQTNEFESLDLDAISNSESISNSVSQNLLEDETENLVFNQLSNGIRVTEAIPEGDVWFMSGTLITLANSEVIFRVYFIGGIPVKIFTLPGDQHYTTMVSAIGNIGGAASVLEQFGCLLVNNNFNPGVSRENFTRVTNSEEIRSLKKMVINNAAY